MAVNLGHSLTIDLNRFKLYLRLTPKIEFTLHFDTPSRKWKDALPDLEHAPLFKVAGR